MKKTVIYAGIAFSALFLWLALRDTHWGGIKQAFANASIWPIIPMYICLACFYWLKAVRWRVLLSPSHQVGTRKLVPAMMAGAAGNNLLPAHFGEIVRVYYAGSRLNIPKSTVLATLVLERVLDIIVVLGILSIAFVFGGFSRALLGAGSLLLVIAVSVSLLCIALTLYNDRAASFVKTRLTFLSVSLRQKIVEQIINVGAGLASLREGRLYFQVLINSLVQWLLMAGCIYCALVALKIDVSPLVAIVILGITVAGLALPTSPGFFGTIEYCFVLGLATVGVDANTAVSAAIFYHVPAWLAVTLGGLLIVHLNHASFRQLKEEASRS